MADCTMEITWVDNPTYEDVKKLYERFETTVSQMAQERISAHFNFRCGRMNYVVKSIEEFTETAFGETDFSLTALQFSANLPDQASVRINYLCGLTCSASSKVLLEKFKEGLSLEMCFEVRQSQGQENTPGRPEAHAAVSANDIQGVVNSPITINGSGNVINVAGGSISGNEVENEQKHVKTTEESNGVKAFFSGVLQNVTSNAVWYLLVLIGTALLSYFATN